MSLTSTARMSTKRRKLNPAHPETQARTNGHAYQNGRVAKGNAAEVARPIAPGNEAWTISDIIQIYLPMFGFIFGGCCSNVYALEALINTCPSSGNIITALQFLLTSLITLPANVDLRRPSSWRHAFLRERKIPLQQWAIYTSFFLAINVLNNTALSYHISIPLHIILRSAGPVTTMLVLYFVSGRRFPPIKILSVLLLFIGVVVSAVSDAYSKTPEAFNTTVSATKSESRSTRLAFPSLLSSTALQDQAPGFALLAAALLLSAFMGLYSDNLYACYGRSSAVASESLFYSHTLSLPFFAFQYPQIVHSLATLTANSPPLSTTLALASNNTISKLYLPSFLDHVPSAIPMLVLNAITQYVCINGVNRLSARSSSLTVSIALNIRKLASLLLSIWLFGNRLPMGVVAGAALVFAGGGLYAVPSGKDGKREWTEKQRKNGVAKKVQ